MPGSAVSPVGDFGTPPEGERAGGARSSVLRITLAVGIAAAVAVLAWTHRATVYAGSDVLSAADLEWLVVAALAATALWVAGTVTQLGSMPLRPPVGQVLAVQLAAMFVNQLSPAGSGGIGLNVRFLRRRGLGWGAAMGATGLNSLAGLITHLLLLVVAVLVSPAVASRITVPVSWHPLVVRIAGGFVAARPWLVGAAAALIVAMGALLLTNTRPRLLGWCTSAWARMVAELRGLGSVLRNPYRAAALWLGSLSIPLLHAAVLFAVLRSVGVELTVTTAVVVYLVVSSVSALIPSPGGLGALDVTLITGLVVMGVPSTVALGAVLGYRLITVWIPLLPGAMALAVLVRRRII